MAAINTIGGLAGGKAVSPPSYAEEVTPSDTDELEYVARAIYVGDGEPKDVRVTTLGGSDVTLRNLQGTHILLVVKVWETGTTATNIIAEW